MAAIEQYVELTPNFNVLFLCTHNACRSILAEAIARQLALGLPLTFMSAGSAPSGKVHPMTLKHLQLQGYSTAGLHSKSWEALADFSPDLVITVCDSAAGETCPLWLGNTPKLHWGLPDPSQLNVEDQDVLFFKIIRLLEGRIGALLRVDLKAEPRVLSAALQQIVLAHPLVD